MTGNMLSTQTQSHLVAIARMNEKPRRQISLGLNHVSLDEVLDPLMYDNDQQISQVGTCAITYFKDLGFG